MVKKSPVSHLLISQFGAVHSAYSNEAKTRDEKNMRMKQQPRRTWCDM